MAADKGGLGQLELENIWVRIRTRCRVLIALIEICMILLRRQRSSMPCVNAQGNILCQEGGQRVGYAALIVQMTSV